MKAGLLALSSLLTLAAAQPAGRHAAHQQHHEKRDVVVVTETAAPVVVYVDQFGNTISAPAPAATPAPAAAPAFSPAAAAPKAPAAAPKKAAVAASVSSSSSSSASSKSSSSSSKSGLSIAYSPYNSDGSCKTADEVAGDFQRLSGYTGVRIYGTDCNQVSNVIAAAKPLGMNIMAGVYDISDIPSQISLLAQGFSSNWEGVTAVSIGNELVNSGKASVSDVVAAVNIARPLLRAAGFNGDVVTVDTYNTVIANPELCAVSDFAAVNAHPFFDPTATAQNAGPWAKKTIADVSSACGGKKTVITEIGWPSAGSVNGDAIPSPENQQAAISSVKSTFTHDVTVFSAFNDQWKANTAATFNTEQWWGILGNSAE